MPACCLKCHFRWEEREVLPYLPPDVQDRLLREHAAIERCGFPKSLVDDHGDRELVPMRRYCPPELVAAVEADHEHLDGNKGCGCG